MVDEDERDETEAERLDRNWNDMLQELRVVQTGVQLLSGFLLTLPFTTRFGDIDVWQQRLYLTLVLLAGLAIGVTLTPIMIHRRVFGELVKDRVVASGHLFLQVVMALLALIIIGATDSVRRVSPVTKRILELLDGIAIAAVIPLLLWIAGVYDVLRNLRF